MNDISKTPVSVQSTKPVDMPSNQREDRLPVATSRIRVLRPWLFFGFLVLLIILLIVREDIRKEAVLSVQNAASYIAFDLVGLSPRELFIWRLRLAGLLDSPLGQRWSGAVERASQQPIAAGNRYQAQESFKADEVEAHIYQVTLARGEQLVWQLSRLDTEDSRFYAALEQREHKGESWSTVTDLAFDGETQRRVISTPGDFRIVLQPELFAKIDYSLAIATGGSLSFPVKGAKQRDIGSVFGDPRDGGARKHHGVDIFAPRGTPVLAVIDGHVKADTSRLGGKHVWLSGGMLGFGKARYYYAHLDSFAVESGDKVKKGEVIGYVGNTGNARTTPPHLHFGIYANGPIDPAPFLKPKPTLPAS